MKKLTIISLSLLLIQCVDEIKRVEYSDIQGYWIDLNRKEYPYKTIEGGSLNDIDYSRPRYYKYYKFDGCYFWMYVEEFITCHSYLSTCSGKEWLQYFSTKAYKGTVRTFEVESRWSDVSGKILMNIFFQRIDRNGVPIIDNQEVATVILMDMYDDTLKVAYSVEPTCERARWERGYTCISDTSSYLRVSKEDFVTIRNTWYSY